MLLILECYVMFALAAGLICHSAMMHYEWEDKETREAIGSLKWRRMNNLHTSYYRFLIIFGALWPVTILILTIAWLADQHLKRNH